MIYNIRHSRPKNPLNARFDEKDDCKKDLSGP